MPLDYCILASGSSGNAVWVRGNGTEVLLDCGIGPRGLRAPLAAVNTEVGNIRAVVCTHHHGDHAAGIPALARGGADVYATPPTLRRLSKRVCASRLRPVEPGRTVNIGGLRVQTVPTSHDAPGSVALVVSDGVSKLGMATDLGRKTKRLVRAFSGVDAVILESNHDLNMLVHGPYPASVKQRIRSPFGHLSNAEAADLLADIAHRGLRHITLVHLSQENNTPEHAAAAVEPVLANCAANATLRVARRDSLDRPTTLTGAGPLFAAL